MDLSNLARVEGPNLALRLIRPEDAEYVHRLRTDPTSSLHLSKVQGSVEDQRNWIETYKAREAEGKELYYVIERMDGQRCGLVRHYDIGIESFTWGSWMLDFNKPRKAALESAYLVYQIAFDLQGLLRAQFDVRRDNENTIAFHRRFGATETHTDELNIYFVYPRARFQVDRDGYLALLKEAAL
jgi:RimJ/RimL family protein N-acetyltransferase